MRHLLLAVSLFVSVIAAADQPADKLKILTVVTGTERPLQVVLLSNRDATKAGAIGGALGALIAIGLSKNEAEKLGVELNKTVPPFDRKPTVESTLKSYVESKYPVFEIVFPDRSDKYLANKKANYEQLKGDGYKFMLVIDDLYTGLRAPNGYMTSNDSVYPAVGLQYELYDVDNKKVIEKNSREGHGIATKPMKEALQDREFFTAPYPTLVNIAARDIVGLLLRSNKLNLMASRVGLSDKVPALGTVLASYEKQFSYSLANPKGWRRDKSASKFMVVTAPLKNKDRAKIGVTYVIDLLIPELGQSVPSVDDYSAIYFSRLSDMGYKLETIKEFSDLQTEKSYKQYMIDRPDGIGKEIILFRMVDATYVEIFGVVFIDSYESYFAQYKADIQTIVNDTKLTISGSH